MKCGLHVTLCHFICFSLSFMLLAALEAQHSTNDQELPMPQTTLITKARCVMVERLSDLYSVSWRLRQLGNGQGLVTGVCGL